MKIILASNNAKKMNEMRALLSDIGVEIISPRELGISLEVEESGVTFEENAFLKAAAFCEAAGIPAVADDSGLAVEALKGAPGVYSARYGGQEIKTDEERYLYLLKNMEGIENRKASFVSCIVCTFGDGRSITVRGECHGEILREPLGEGGFGYDPVFYMPEYGMTMAQMDAELKNKVSHRAKAIEMLKEKLKGWGEYADK